MIVEQLLQTLARNPQANIEFMLPERTAVPAHFHVTEVGRVQKNFIDCGGTVRAETVCVLQVWVANDLDHRLDATKLARILTLAAPVLKSTDLAIEVEYESRTISRFFLSDADVSESTIQLNLSAKHTGCLAPELCGLNIISANGRPTGCC